MRTSFSAALAAVLALAALTAGCKSTPDGDITSSIESDYRVRHPIAVGEGRAVLDLPVGGGPGGVTLRQRDEIYAFVAQWRKSGRGPLVVARPVGGSNEAQARFATKTIAGILNGEGIAKPYLVYRTYPADGADHLAPVLLSFPRLEAKVESTCGVWPEDTLNGSKLDANTRNRDYYNFGCATQSNLAAMVADPEDLVRPRATDYGYGARRATVLEKYGKGESSATEYPDAGGGIADVGQ